MTIITLVFRLLPFVISVRAFSKEHEKISAKLFWGFVGLMIYTVVFALEVNFIEPIFLPREPIVIDYGDYMKNLFIDFVHLYVITLSIVLLIRRLLSKLIGNQNQ